MYSQKIPVYFLRISKVPSEIQFQQLSTKQALKKKEKECKKRKRNKELCEEKKHCSRGKLWSECEIMVGPETLLKMSKNVSPEKIIFRPTPDDINICTMDYERTCELPPCIVIIPPTLAQRIIRFLRKSSAALFWLLIFFATLKLGIWGTPNNTSEMISGFLKSVNKNAKPQFLEVPDTGRIRSAVVKQWNKLVMITFLPIDFILKFLRKKVEEPPIPPLEEFFIEEVAEPLCALKSEEELEEEEGVVKMPSYKSAWREDEDKFEETGIGFLEEGMVDKKELWLNMPEFNLAKGRCSMFNEEEVCTLEGWMGPQPTELIEPTPLAEGEEKTVSVACLDGSKKKYICRKFQRNIREGVKLCPERTYRRKTCCDEKKCKCPFKD